MLLNYISLFMLQTSVCIMTVLPLSWLIIFAPMMDNKSQSLTLFRMKFAACLVFIYKLWALFEKIHFVHYWPKIENLTVNLVGGLSTRSMDCQLGQWTVNLASALPFELDCQLGQCFPFWTWLSTQSVDCQLSRVGGL